MFAQDGIYSTHNKKPIRYDSLKDCMLKIAYYISDLQEKSKVVISAPMFGSGLAGGDWQIIEKMIKEIWSSIDVIVYFTKLPKGYEKRQINSETLILKV